MLNNINSSIITNNNSFITNNALQQAIQTYVQQNNKDFILLKKIQTMPNNNTQTTYAIELKNVEDYFNNSSACCRKCFDYSYNVVLQKQINSIIHTGGYFKTKKILDEVLNNNSYSFNHNENNNLIKNYSKKNNHIILFENFE